MAARLLGMGKNFKWYHWAGGVGTAVAFNTGCLAAMAKGYRWYYSEDEEADRSFREKYGLPTEAQRLAVFSWMARDWDKTIGVVQKGGADVYRKEMLVKARGDVLEVAVGTGRSLEVLKDSEEVKSFVGIDCVEAMLDEARPKLEGTKFPARVQQANAHRLPFSTDSFDTVVGTLCLCSMEHPAKALEEMARVTRPDGQILLVEPGLASSWVVRSSQRYLGLVPQAKHAWEFGWYDDLDPPALVRACPQLELTSMNTRAMGNWYLIAAKKRAA